MKGPIYRLIRDSFTSWAMAAAEAFPMQLRCSRCNHPMEETTEMIRYCPNCATPLHGADPWSLPALA